MPAIAPPLLKSLPFLPFKKDEPFLNKLENFPVLVPSGKSKLIDSFESA